MVTEIYWVEAPHGRLAVLARPRGGDYLDDDARAWKSNGLTGIVSLLDLDEAESLQLDGEGAEVEAQGMQFFSFPIVDGGAPESMRDARALIARLVEIVKSGGAVGAHCRAGIGRSPTIIVATLAASGVPLARARRAVSEARGWPVPETPEQLEWLEKFTRSSP